MARHDNGVLNREPWLDGAGETVGYGSWLIVCADCDRDVDPDHVFEIRRVRRMRFDPDDVALAEQALADHQRLTQDW
jgi:hypothetical protein